MRWIVGPLLVGASVLKAAQLFTEPTTAVVSGRLLLPVQIGVELGVGLLALSGIYWRQLRWLALFLFVGFAGYSAYLAMSGATTCGCFGPVRIHPWWTFGLDLAVVVGLVVSIGTAHPSKSLPNHCDNARPVPYVAGWRSLIAGIAATTVIAAAFLVRYVDRHTAAAEGVLPTSGDLVILQPEEWIGKPLPIADFIDVDLSTGEWIVLLHRHDCLDCQEAVPRYEQLALLDTRVALIELPPYGEFGRREGTCRYGRLKDDRDWFVQTPVEIQLQDGVVTAVKGYGD